MADVTYLHHDKPSLRLILADALYFAVALFVAMAWIAAVIITAAIVIAPFWFAAKAIIKTLLPSTL